MVITVYLVCTVLAAQLVLGTSEEVDEVRFA